MRGSGGLNIEIPRNMPRLRWAVINIHTEFLEPGTSISTGSRSRVQISMYVHPNAKVLEHSAVS